MNDKQLPITYGGMDGTITFPNGYTVQVLEWSCGSSSPCSVTTAPPIRENSSPGIISASGTFDCIVDDCDMCKLLRATKPPLWQRLKSSLKQIFSLF